MFKYVNFQGICLAQHRFLYFWDVGVGRHHEGHCRIILWTKNWDKDEVTHSNVHGCNTLNMAHWKQENKVKAEEQTLLRLNETLKD